MKCVGRPARLTAAGASQPHSGSIPGPAGGSGALNEPAGGTAIQKPAHCHDWLPSRAGRVFVLTDRLVGPAMAAGLNQAAV